MKKYLWITVLAVFLATLAQPAVYKVSAAGTPENLATAQISPALAVLMEGHRLSIEYGSRPPYTRPAFPKNEPLSIDQADAVIPYLIACESRDRSIKIVDSNGYYSYGPLQIQNSTAELFNSIGHTDLDPMVPVQAVQLAEIAIENGYLYRWSCARILGIIQ